MGQAVLDSLLNDIHEHRVWSKRGGNEVRKTWMIGGRLGGERRKVAVPMIAGPKKVWDNYNTHGTIDDTRIESASNRGLGKLHMRWFDNRESVTSLPFHDEFYVSSI